MSKPFEITISIPTFGRNKTLMSTISYLLDQNPPAAELLIMDQTPQHDPNIEKKLSEWDTKNAIRWIRLNKPSITEAMNAALCMASHPIVLFVDDDGHPRGVGRHLNDGVHNLAIEVFAVF